MLSIVFLATCIGSSLGIPSEYFGERQFAIQDLFESDILGLDDFYDRNAVVGKHKLWPGGIIPYVIESNLNETLSLLTLEAAFESFHRDTCIRFVPRTNESNYIKFFSGQGCYSYVGHVNIGDQPLSLGRGCGHTGIILHLLGHALGFYHEQNRSDRDDHLIIYWDNILKGPGSILTKFKPQENLLLGQFDYDSIMALGSFYGSKDPKKLKTMIGKNGEILKDPIDKYCLSHGDIQKINILYGCKKNKD